MKYVVSRFPLLRLPINAVLKTLRAMTYRQKLGVSLLSKRTRGLVESMKLTTREFHVEFKSYLLIMLFFRNDESFCIHLGQFQVDAPLRAFETPGKIHFRGDDPEEWTNLLSVKQLLDHLKCIFYTSITTLRLSVKFARSSLESVHKSVKGFDTIYLSSGDHEYNKMILSVLKPASISLKSGALVDRCVPRDLFTQNFELIHVRCSLSVQITLDKLLMTNVQGIDMVCRQTSAKILNKFLKLWAKGSNPRLEIMFLAFPIAGFQNEELLRGLIYQDAPRNTERLFKISGYKEPKKVIGGWDIRRLDGTRATITAFRTFDSVDFKLFVWHDHCDVS